MADIFRAGELLKSVRHKSKSLLLLLKYETMDIVYRARARSQLLITEGRAI